MKKLALALVCLVSVAFFASCDPTDIISDPAPKLAVITGEGYITGTVESPTTIALDDLTDYKYGFYAESNALTKKELVSLKVVLEYTKANGETGTSTVEKDLKGLTSYNYEEKVFDDAKNMYDAFTVTATLTDADNQVSTATLAYKVEVEENLVAQPFTWTRLGSNPGTGLEQFGLKWESNLKDVHAIIKPLDDAKLYVIDNLSEWENINTELAKATFFSELPALSAAQFGDLVLTGYLNQDAERNFLLATIYNGNNYLIRIQKTRTTTKAYEWSIMGEYK